MNKILFLISLFSIFAYSSEPLVGVGEQLQESDNRIELLESEIIPVINPRTVSFNASISPDSVEWVRAKGVLPLPRVLVIVKSKLDAKRLSVSYQGVNYQFQQTKFENSEARFYASPYETSRANLKIDGKTSSRLGFYVKRRKASEAHTIDYNCYKYGLEVKGMDGEHLSVGCSKTTHGSFGSEKALLQVHWIAPAWTSSLEGSEHNIATISGDNPVEINLVGAKNKRRRMRISASSPDRNKRLFLAVGFGPYHYISKSNNETFDDEISFMYMLYSKFVLTEKHSVKLFDAFIQKESTFNNLGAYFSSDIAKIWDERLTFNTLIGFQDLLFETPEVKQHKIIYPQGIEMIYDHAFGLKNYKLMLGGFIDLGASIDYNNVWIRFGKRVFWELNYLKWEEDESKAESFGLSVGIPLMSIF